MEVINSFFSNIKDKLTNPFFGTLILVLLIDHWELWYAVFNFGENYSLNQKVEFIEDYIATNLTVYSFIWDIIQAFLYMLLGYLIVVSTRSLVIWIEYNLMPTITGKVVNKNVVRKSEYDQVIKEREEYFDQYEEQRENVRKFSKSIDEQNTLIKEKDKDLLDQSEKISSTIRSLDRAKNKIEQLENILEKEKKKLEENNKELEKNDLEYRVLRESIVQYQDIFFDKKNKDFYNSLDKFPPEILETFNILIEENLWGEFLNTAKFFDQGGSTNYEIIYRMIKKGVVLKVDHREILSPIGLILWRYRDIFNLEYPYPVN